MFDWYSIVELTGLGFGLLLLVLGLLFLRAAKLAVKRSGYVNPSVSLFEGCFSFFTANLLFILGGIVSVGSLLGLAITFLVQHHL